MTPTDTKIPIQGPAALPLPTLPPWSLELQRILGGELATRERRNVPNGVSCYYYELTLPDGSKVGAKLYGDNSLPAKIRDRQRLASLDGWAPAAGDTFSFKIYGGSGAKMDVYGYLTEVAETMGPFTPAEEKAVEADFTRRYGDAGDIGPKNCGRVRGGYVAIDFDDASTSDGGASGCPTCKAKALRDAAEEDKPAPPARPMRVGPGPDLEPPLTPAEMASPLPDGWERDSLGAKGPGGTIFVCRGDCRPCRLPGGGIAQFRKARALQAARPLLGAPESSGPIGA